MKTLFNQLTSTLFHLEHRRKWVPLQGWVPTFLASGALGARGERCAVNPYNNDEKTVRELDAQIAETRAALAGIRALRRTRHKGKRARICTSCGAINAADVFQPEPISDHPRYI